LFDESGRIAAEFIYHDEKRQWTLALARDDRMSVVASGIAAIDVPEVLGFNAAGDSILMQFVENGIPIWRPVSLRDGSLGEPLANGKEFRTVITDRKTGRIIGGIRGIDPGHYVFFDNESKASSWPMR
jgi:hypothetical protein